MKISPVVALAVTAVAAMESSSSEQPKLLSIAFDRLQQTELIGRVGRHAVHLARLGSGHPGHGASQDHSHDHSHDHEDPISESCVNGTETVNADSSYQDSLTQIESW